MPLAQYSEYNLVRVTISINGETIDLSSLLKDPQLREVTISDPPAFVMTNGSVGASGSVTFYGSDSSKLEKLYQHSESILNSTSSLLIPINIEIGCWTGEHKYSGFITDWTVQFSGSGNIYQFNWNVLGPNTSLPRDSQDLTAEQQEAALPKEYKTPLDYFDAVSAQHTVNLRARDKDGKEVPYSTLGLKWLGGDSDSSSSKKRSIGGLHDIRRNINDICYHSLTSNGDYVVMDPGRVETDPEGYSVIWIYVVKKESGQLGITRNTNYSVKQNELIFVYGGDYSAGFNRTLKLSDGSVRIVVPIAEYTFKSDFASATFVYKAFKSSNGVVIVSNDSVRRVPGSLDEARNQADLLNLQNQAKLLSATMRVFNCMNFDVCDPSSRVAVLIYDGLGRRHFSSGSYYVRSVEYTITSAVVEASVELSMDIAL